jgi:polyphenol oxidase
MPAKTKPVLKRKRAPKPKHEAVLRARVFDVRRIVHGFSTRIDPENAGESPASTRFAVGLQKNDFNLGFVDGFPRAAVERNRAAFIRAVDGSRSPRWTLVQMKQIHSDIIHVLRAAPEHPLSGDGLVTDVPGLLLAAKTADCVPVLIADPKRRVVGAFHAGWRGTAKRIVEKGVGVMRRDFGSDPANLHAAIGPCIRACCYEIGDEVREAFRSQFAYDDELFVENFDVDPVYQKYPNLFLTARAPGHAEISRQIHLDLVAANRRQLLEAGLRERNIEVVGECTACHTDWLFSHRKERGNTGRMMAVIGIRE